MKKTKKIKEEEGKILCVCVCVVYSGSWLRDGWVIRVRLRVIVVLRREQ
jgi:hypothetical protein